AIGQPAPQVGGSGLQSMLHVDALGLVTRKGQVKSFDAAAVLPAGNLLGIVEITIGIALAEDQPVAEPAFGDALAEHGTQAGDSGAVADEDDRHMGIRRMEGGVGAHAGADFSTERGVFGQPAGAQAETAVGATPL